MRKMIKRYPRVSRPENRDRVSYQTYTLDGGSGLMSRIDSNRNVPPDARSALTIAAVWQAIGIYANYLGMFDFYVAESVKSGHRQATDHPVHDLVHITPNPRNTAFIFRQTMMVQCRSRGNAYAEIERDRRGTPIALWPMCPVATEPILKPSGELVYRTPAAGHPGTYVEIPERDVIHIREMGYDPIKGLSPVECMKRTLGLAVSQESHQASTMENQAVPQGLLKLPGNNKADPVGMRTRADWDKVHGGSLNAGKIAILTGGMDFIRTQFSPADAELLLSRTFSIGDVARMYNLPPFMLGLGEAPSDIEDANRAFFTCSLSPWVTQWEQELTKKLLDAIDRTVYFIKNDVGSLLAGNVAAQTAQDTADKQNGVKSPNEIRVSRGLTPLDIPAADYHWIETNNLTPIEDPSWGKVLPVPVAPAPVALVDPDDVSNQNPTIEDPALDEVPPEPEPNPALYEAMRGVVTDPFGRLLHREMQQVRKASKKDEFETWHETYYASQVSTVVEAITPALGALSALRGVPLDPMEVADRFLARGRSEVRGLITSVPPDELPGAVDRLCSQWSEVRIAEMVDSLLEVVS